MAPWSSTCTTGRTHTGGNGTAGLPPGTRRDNGKRNSKIKCRIPWDGGALWVCGDAVNPSVEA